MSQPIYVVPAVGYGFRTVAQLMRPGKPAKKPQRIEPIAPQKAAAAQPENPKNSDKDNIKKNATANLWLTQPEGVKFDDVKSAIKYLQRVPEPDSEDAHGIIGRYTTQINAEGHTVVKDFKGRPIATVTPTHTAVSENVASGDTIHSVDDMKHLIKAALIRHNGDFSVGGASDALRKAIQDLAVQMVKDGELPANSKIGGMLLDAETAQAAMNAKTNSPAPPEMTFYKPHSHYTTTYTYNPRPVRQRRQSQQLVP